MDLTNQLLDGGGWEAPADCELVVQSLLFGDWPTVVRLERGQRVGFAVDTRPHATHREPPPAFAGLEVDGQEVWRNPSRGGVKVRLRLLGTRFLVAVTE